ncbi:MAG: hypothetical protein ACRDD7_13055 [Peptostreptococcaceae bacterium]
MNDLFENSDDILDLKDLHSIRVPKEGNKLFINGGGYYEFSYIDNHDMRRQFYAYIEGYKTSADLIIKNALESGEIRILDTCIYPAVFLYRQYLELMLKHIYIAHSDDDYETKSTTIKRTGHNIKYMWDNKVESIINKYFPDDDKSTLNAAKDYIHEFSNEDGKSFKYRYPIDKDLNLFHNKRNDINLRNLYERMSELEHFLDGVDAGISEMKELEAEALAEQIEFMKQIEYEINKELESEYNFFDY